jgi:hypothetical protein
MISYAHSSSHFLSKPWELHGSFEHLFYHSALFNITFCLHVVEITFASHANTLWSTKVKKMWVKGHLIHFNAWSPNSALSVLGMTHMQNQCSNIVAAYRLVQII